MANKPKRPSADIITPGLGEIDKVRDILFGKYVADFEHRFAELESRLEADVDALKQRLVEKIESMDDAVNQSISNLDKQLAGEKKARDSELTSLQSMLTKAEKTLKHSINVMEDQANQDLSAIRKSIEESQLQLMDQMQAAQKEMTVLIENQKRQLEDDKVGRQSLALMLDEVALRLRGNDSE